VETNGHDGDEWVTLAEASERSGLSVDALRRQVKRGRLLSRQEQTRYGPTWLVSAGALPSASARVDSAPTVGARVGVEGGAAVLALVEHNKQLQAELVAKAEAAAMWQARAEFLAGQLEQAQRALEAPKAGPAASEPAPDFEAASGPATRRWWRRAWRWVQV
jgi:hypothetical protein